MQTEKSLLLLFFHYFHVLSLQIVLGRKRRKSELKCEMNSLECVMELIDLISCKNSENILEKFH